MPLSSSQKSPGVQTPEPIIWLASDHAGVEWKNKILQLTSESSSEAARSNGTRSSQLPRLDAHFDLGPYNTDKGTDYPDYADLLANKMRDQPDKSYGILICGSGQGMAIRANRYPWIRAALCWTAEVAKLAREHNNANVICLGSRTQKWDDVPQILQVFFATTFAGGRHEARVAKLSSPVDKNERY